MVGQYLPQTNEKCYSVLQWLMWLFLPFFSSSKHSMCWVCLERMLAEQRFRCKPPDPEHDPREQDDNVLFATCQCVPSSYDLSAFTLSIEQEEWNSFCPKSIIAHPRANTITRLWCFFLLWETLRLTTPGLYFESRYSPTKTRLLWRRSIDAIVHDGVVFAPLLRN